MCVFVDPNFQINQGRMIIIIRLKKILFRRKLSKYFCTI